MTSSADIRLISNSEVQTFKRCERRWALRYVWGWETQEQEVAGPLPFGTAIHGALEAYYGQKRDPLEWWAQHSTCYDLEDKRQEKDARLGRVMLEGYLDWVAETGADESLEVVAAEEFVTVPFATIRSREVHLTGRLDLRVRDDRLKQTTFLDHKTAQNLEPDLFRSEQLLHYDLIDMIRSGGKHDLAGGTINKLRKVLRTSTAVPPFYDRLYDYHTEEDLRRFARRLTATIQRMLVAEEQYWLHEPIFEDLAAPSHDRSCAWQCDFVQPCKMMDDGAPWREYLNDLYTKEPSDYTRRNRADWFAATE